MSNFYNLTSAYQNTVAKISNNDIHDDTQNYLSHKTLEKQRTLDLLSQQEDVRTTTITQPSQNSYSAHNPLDPKQPPLSLPSPGDSTLDTLLAAFKDSHDILSEVILIMMLMSQQTGDSAQREADDLTSLVQNSKDLNMAANALNAINDYIKKQQALTPTSTPPGPNMGPYNIAEIAAAEPSLANALQTLGGLSSNPSTWTNDTCDTALATMSTLVQGDMTGVDSTIQLDTFKQDTLDLIAELQNTSTSTKDVTATAGDMYKQMTDVANEATNVNQTKSAQLQGMTNNYQMQLSMVTSFLQRIQDLNNKITSLT